MLLLWTRALPWCGRLRRGRIQGVEHESARPRGDSAISPWTSPSNSSTCPSGEARAVTHTKRAERSSTPARARAAWRCAPPRSRPAKKRRLRTPGAPEHVDLEPESSATPAIRSRRRTARLGGRVLGEGRRVFWGYGGRVELVGPTRLETSPARISRFRGACLIRGARRSGAGRRSSRSPSTMAVAGRAASAVHERPRRTTSSRGRGSRIAAGRPQRPRTSVASRSTAM